MVIEKVDSSIWSHGDFPVSYVELPEGNKKHFGI